MNDGTLIAVLGVLITVSAVLVPRVVKAQRWRGNGSGGS